MYTSFKDNAFKHMPKARHGGTCLDSLHLEG